MKPVWIPDSDEERVVMFLTEALLCLERLKQTGYTYKELSLLRRIIANTWRIREAIYLDPTKNVGESRDDHEL